MKSSLQRAFDEAVGPYVEPCPVCKGPSPGAIAMVKLGPGEEVPRCPECGEAVDHDGKTLCRLTTEGIGTIIIIRETA